VKYRGSAEGNKWQDARLHPERDTRGPRHDPAARLAGSPFHRVAWPGGADPAPVIHYAPGENLERIDVALIDSARQEIDMAAYVLTDWPVIQALTRAADRGVKVRIYLDGAQLAEREPAKVFQDLAETPNNDLIVIKSAEAAAAFRRAFEARFASGESLSIGARQ
jgi:phosphatidylserine/phosphatidylglycerophosphate/cardiolipin synthase-like enzyme